MNTNKALSVCFSGYRPGKFSFNIENDGSELQDLQIQIENSILKALKQGYRVFYCGMAKGFDLLAADILLDIREREKEYQDTLLISVLPYSKHEYKGNWKNIHNLIKACSDQIVIISPEYKKNCYRLRNQYMVDNSSYMICYWDGQEGGTAQTIRMAKQQGLFIDNISGYNN